MRKERLDYVIAAIGIVLLALGLLLVKMADNPQGLMLALPYVCIGIGCGVFGHGMGNFISRKSIKNNPDIQKQLDINHNDERNIAIATRAKAKGYDLMAFVFIPLMLIFVLMRIDIIALLLLFFAYVFVQGYAIYYRYRYDKEM